MKDDERWFENSDPLEVQRGLGESSVEQKQKEGGLTAKQRLLIKPPTLLLDGQRDVVLDLTSLCFECFSSFPRAIEAGPGFDPPQPLTPRGHLNPEISRFNINIINHS